MRIEQGKFRIKSERIEMRILSSYPRLSDDLNRQQVIWLKRGSHVLNYAD
jgi:hypothetical protein